MFVVGEEIHCNIPLATVANFCALWLNNDENWGTRNRNQDSIKNRHRGSAWKRFGLEIKLHYAQSQTMKQLRKSEKI